MVVFNHNQFSLPWKTIRNKESYPCFVEFLSVYPSWNTEEPEEQFAEHHCKLHPHVQQQQINNQFSKIHEPALKRNKIEQLHIYYVM